MVTNNGLGQASGTELQALRQALGIESQLGIAALLHFLGGVPVALSTISRQERLAAASSTELVAFLRLLFLVRPQPPAEGSQSTEPPPPNLNRFLDYRLGASRSNADAWTIEQASADWRELLLTHLRGGHPLPVELLDGQDDRDFILRLVLAAPGVAAQHLLRLGYGPETASRPETEPCSTER
ncbi:hypothetical protein [Azospirillum argentinense]|uniref:Uncharacterized protein n=1 Tax=Azospirillum argentinense TaxID=2970906 RepID=A0A5B0KPG7_9PROT|nr:hypothetical protein [Azospirillum argentinense]KAA1053786.1 hypothetical protein FH063_002368 [Azospirillum argentinense]